jgi:hypothetical protein
MHETSQLAWVARSISGSVFASNIKGAQVVTGPRQTGVHWNPKKARAG